MRKRIDRQTFNELLIKNPDCAEKDIENMQPILDAIRPFVPDAEPLFSVLHDDEEHTNYLDGVRIGFRRNGIQFFVSHRTYPKSVYSIYYDCSEMQYIDSYSEIRARDGLTEPNRIGTFSQKKIEAWVDYLTQCYRKLESIDTDNRKKIAAFRQKLEKLSDIHRGCHGNSGEIKRNGLTYSFEIRKTEINENIRLGYQYSTLDDFLKLSDNKLSEKR